MSRCATWRDLSNFIVSWSVPRVHKFQRCTFYPERSGCRTDRSNIWVHFSSLRERRGGRELVDYYDGPVEFGLKCFYACAREHRVCKKEGKKNWLAFGCWHFSNAKKWAVSRDDRCSIAIKEKKKYTCWNINPADGAFCLQRNLQDDDQKIYQCWGVRGWEGKGWGAVRWTRGVW